MRLRYIGSAPTSFMALGAEVFPGDSFEVPDEVAAGYLARADVEEAPAAGVRSLRKSKPSVSETAGLPPEPTVTPEEVSHGVPDDH